MMQETIRNETLKSLPNAVAQATAFVSLSSQNGGSEIYILGISHVSLDSCQHIRTLISTIQPDTVVLELCKDRTLLLVPENADPPAHWNASSVVLTVEGMPPPSGSLDATWPPTEKLLSMLHCSPGVIVTIEDIEDDILTLLRTGLFGSVTPRTLASSPLAGPTFFSRTGKSFHGHQAEVEVVAPLEAIEYKATPRILPPIKSLHVEWTGIPDDEQLCSLQDLGSRIKDQVLTLLSCDNNRSHPTSTLCALIYAASLLQEALSICTINRIDGIESGNVILYASTSVVATNANQTTGLECTVDSHGRGIGITPYPWRTFGTVSSSSGQDRTHRRGTDEEKGPEIMRWEQHGFPYKETCSEDLPDQFTNALASIMTTKYAELQSAAGSKVGIGSGAAWQTALQASAETSSGVQRIVLGDRPASITGYNLAKSINAALIPYLAASIISFSVSAAGLSFGASTTTTDFSLLGFPTFVLASGCLGFAFLTYVSAAIGLPFLEIYRLSQLSSTDIEKAVALKAPLQQPTSGDAKPVLLSGEDALLKWPGAMNPILHERDEYMTKVLLGLVGGRSESGVPTYVRRHREGEGSCVLRYAMPDGGPPEACPQGQGDGKFKTWPAKKVVAIVGTAHVRGILRAFEDLGCPERADVSLAHLCRCKN